MEKIKVFINAVVTWIRNFFKKNVKESEKKLLRFFSVVIRKGNFTLTYFSSTGDVVDNMSVTTNKDEFKLSEKGRHEKNADYTKS